MYVFGSGPGVRFGGERVRGLGVGFTNRVGVGTVGVWDVGLYLGCGGVGDVGGERVGDLEQGLEECGVVMSV